MSDYSPPPKKEWKTKDSGHRRTFDTGAQRDRAKGKGRYDLISPFAIQRLCGVYERGAEKYSDRNYERGMPLAQYIDSAIRHLLQCLEGKLDEDHAGQALWNVASLIHTEELIKRGILSPDLNDLPCYMPADGDEEEWRKENRLIEGWLDGETKED